MLTIKEHAEQALAKDNLTVQDLKEVVLEMVGWIMRGYDCERSALEYAEQSYKRCDSSILHARERLEKEFDKLRNDLNRHVSVAISEQTDNKSRLSTIENRVETLSSCFVNINNKLSDICEASEMHTNKLYELTKKKKG